MFLYYEHMQHMKKMKRKEEYRFTYIFGEDFDNDMEVDLTKEEAIEKLQLFLETSEPRIEKLLEKFEKRDDLKKELVIEKLFENSLF